MSKPTEGENDLVAETMANIIFQIQPLIEGKFVESFEVSFELEGKRYMLSLNEETQ